jgi:hypothetical protein
MVSQDSTGAGEELAFDAPTEWRRRTLLSYSPPEEAGLERAAVVVVQEPLSAGETLPTFASRYLAEVRDTPEFVGVDVRRRLLDGRKALELSYEWRTDDGPVAQTATMVVTEGDREPMITIVTTTCARRDAAALSPIFARIVKSMRFGKPPSSGRASRRFGNPPASGIAPKRETDSWNVPELPPAPPIPFIPIPGSDRRG